MNRLLSAVTLACVCALPFAAVAEAPSPELRKAIDGNWRSETDKARDVYRHPAEALTFWGLKPDQTVVEFYPGNGGWWTQILAPYARATGGTYIAAINNGADPAFYAAVADEALYGKVTAYSLTGDVSELPANTADLVLIARAFHNWARRDGLTDHYLKAAFDTLKPGGILAVEQHRAAEGADPKAGSGYVPESYVIEAAQKAGFVLEGKSEINANPKDTRDHPFGVWTLPPVRSSAARGERPAADFDRAKYDAIGESDRMTLKFRKPLQ